MSRSIFKISAEMQYLSDLLEDFDGDITEADKEADIDALFAKIAENEAEFENKVDDYIYAIANFEARAEGRKAEAKRLQILVNQDTANADRLRARLESFLKMLGKTDFQTRLHKIKFAKAGGKLAIDLDDNASLRRIAPRFKTLMPAFYVLNKDAVREVLEAGKKLTFARLLERRETMRIK